MTNSAKPWLQMLKEAEAAQRRYHSIGDTIDKLYSDLEKLANNDDDREFQIFWANQEVLKPTIYSRAPVPVVTDRFRDRKPLVRRAADLLERALQADVEADELHETLLSVRDDLALLARGAPWIVVKERDGIEVPMCQHVDRKDFRHEPARKWKDECGWVARRAYLTKEEFSERFPDADVSKVTFTEYRQGKELASKNEDERATKKAAVWELWHKGKKRVVWVSEGYDDCLDEKAPWLDLTGFFPCPKPAYGTLKRATLTPVPDFVYYRDQVEEINDLTARIAALSEGLRMKGFYPAGNADVGDAIETAMRNMDNNAILVPINSMAALGTGSLKDAIIWMPVRDVAETIMQLVELRRQMIQDVYEITGLSDIMRGATNAQETLGAQQLKSQYGSVRVSERQAEMARVARDVIRIKAEIMAESMPIADLMTIAQVDDLPSQAEIEKQAAPLQQQLQQMQMQAQQAMMQVAAMPQEQAQPLIQQGQAAMMKQAQPLMDQLQKLSETITQEKVEELLRNQRTRPFVLDIETDSTIEPNEMQDQEKRIAFSNALSPIIQQGVMAMQMAPQLGPFVAESIRFLSSGFRAGREMEDAIDQLADGFENYQPPAQPGEDPQAAQATAQAAQATAAAQQTAAEAKAKEAETKAQMAQGEMQLAQQTASADQQNAQADLAIKGQEAQLAAQKTATEIEKIRADIQLIMAKIGQTQVQADATQRQADVAEQTGAAGIAKTQADIEASKTQTGLAEQQAKVGMDKTKADIGRIGAQAKAITTKEPKDG